MGERIVGILGTQRVRLLAVRSAEAAAVGAAAGGFTAAFLMAGRIVAGPYPAAAAALSAVPLAAGVVLALAGGLRRRVSERPMLQWYVVALATACGAAAVAGNLGGVGAAMGKNWLAALAPAGGLLAAVIVLLRGAPMGAVAATVDRRGDLKERLSTAWELHESGDASLFAGKVRRQAVAAVDGRRLRGVPLWDRSAATLGAVGLALLAAAVMLPFETLESPGARSRRQWRRLAPQAAGTLAHPLAGLDAECLTAVGAAGPIRRIEALVRALETARAEDAAAWRGKVVELDRLAEALRQVLRRGQVDSATARRLTELVRAIERAASALAEGMSASAGQYARAEPVSPDSVVTPPATQSAPPGWTHVYNPAYAEFARTAPADSAPSPGAQPPPVAVPFDRQWNEARRRAAEALQSRTIPPRYRQLVRDFFDPER